jgi:Protein of unknown function, DUF547
MSFLDRTLLASLVLLGGWHQPPAPQSAPQVAEQELTFDHAHAAWTAVLARCVQGERFDYAALSASRAPLDEYLLQLRGVRAEDFATWTREQRFAFWINAYNAFTMHIVLTRYPVKSILSIGSEEEPVWEKAFIPLGHLIGEAEAAPLSLDALENRILRPQFEDARVHAALQRAAESGPPLRADAFQAELLERQLDQQARAWLSDPRLNRFDRGRGQIEISTLFDWREQDFVHDAGSVRAWIERYAPKDEVEWLASAETVEVQPLTFSWKLNDVEREER